MATLDDFSGLLGSEHGLVVVGTNRVDGSTQASVVNAGVMDHPLTGVLGVALVAQGGSAKLAHLRRDPRATLTARSGWMWATVEGRADLVGPDDLPDAFPPEQLPALLREVFKAAGGTHDDWDEYDRVMAEERRCAVFVSPDRVYSNRGG